MALPNYTAASPAPGAAGQATMGEAERSVQQQRVRTDMMTALGFANTQFTQETMPQLRSNIGATGQFYSGARQTAEGSAQRRFKEGNYAITTQGQRMLDDLDRQRVYAAMGLII
jgi:hypothetical protein